MQQKAFTLINRGMNRDLSVSKTGESSAYENHNIRIMARDNDTTLSVTNERGTKEISLGNDLSIRGTVIGWNVLNQNLILFVHDNTNVAYPSKIYRLEYNGEGFTMKKGTQTNLPLYQGKLGFDSGHPIESVVYYENENIQKIYWVDGIHVLRFMNFVADDAEIARWNDTYFDSNRAVDFGVKVTISKDNSGNTRANGTVQYLLTYYNQHGQESGYVWISDLVYLSPMGVGGAVDGTNNNRITLDITNLDTSFSNFRVYSVVRTAYNGQAQAYIVADGDTVGGKAMIIDDGSHLTSVDANSLLYLGSQSVHPGTLTYKDQTLFLGDLQAVSNRGVYEDLEKAIKKRMFRSGPTSDWESGCISFEYSTGDETNDTGHIPYVAETDSYPYKNQLLYSSSQITTFKGGEKYRFALRFTLEDGTKTDAFWIGDKVNEKYPVVNSDGTIKRVVAKCEIPPYMVQQFIDAEFTTVQLMIAEATYADRSIKAQGIVSPTVFNVWNRFNKGLYGSASWMLRPRGADYANRHFEPIHKSTSVTGEIECNYWKEDDPTPYYKLKDINTTPDYQDTFDQGIGADDYLTVVIGVLCKRDGMGYYIQLSTARGKLTNLSAQNALLTHTFDPGLFPYAGDQPMVVEDHDEYQDYSIDIKRMSQAYAFGWEDAAYSRLIKWMEQFNVSLEYLDFSQFHQWLLYANNNRNTKKYYNFLVPGTGYDTEAEAFNANSQSVQRWYTPVAAASSSSWDYKPSYFRKHLMFVDENLVTLNSPEIESGAVGFDNADKYKFRIVGVSRITGGYCDYTVDASPGKMPGENLVKDNTSNEIISWPLWSEYGLNERQFEEGSDTEYHPTSTMENRTSYDYLWGSGIVRYWMHMWNRTGKINGYTDYDNNDYGTLRKKTFANLRYAYSTVYNNYGVNPCIYTPDAIRIFNYTSSQYVGVTVGKDSKYYDGSISDSLSMPANFKYPISYSVGTLNLDGEVKPDGAFLYSSSPVQIEYLSSPHAVISLGTLDNQANYTYRQSILPYVFDTEQITPDSGSASQTGWVVPWLRGAAGSTVPNRYYTVDQKKLTLPSGALSANDQYVFIGELYYDFDSQSEDTRYGGISKSAIQNCRFIAAGPQYKVVNGQNIIYGNQGDTFFQRWDCLKTMPYSTGSANNVIDITSVMLETHINLDGRSDFQRETKYIASLDTEKFNTINPAYSQGNNFFVSRDLGEDFNLDSYRSTITWSLAKTDAATVDEWSHVTLASTLKLDGDKGVCQALRRFQNSIIAFQDRGISEVLFNSRTQLTTTDGVPVEIANSGKVDGKRYITNKFGCLNKWSIVEGKSALYFVDNINKAFCSFNGQGIDTLSSRLGFDVWFRQSNSMQPWTPKMFENLIAFYDRVHSDVYLVKGTEDEMSCLVYNEKLGAFSSFFDYGNIPMMTNVEDHFVSYKNGKFWFQNEGLYGDFFGEPKDFWVQYRVTPDPFGDKIWSGFDYRADFYRILNEDGELVVPEEYIINGDKYGSMDDLYVEDETFDMFKIWNEYQSTGDVDMRNNTLMDKPVTKDFRIWRRQIPRAEVLGTNRYGLDRIRNPWINLQLKKTQTEESGQDLMQLHDVIVRYFE